MFDIFYGTNNYQSDTDAPPPPPPFTYNNGHKRGLLSVRRQPHISLINGWARNSSVACQFFNRGMQR